MDFHVLFVKRFNVDILFKTLTGSRLYGMHNEESDYDTKGFGVESLDYFFGLKEWQQTVTKDEDKKEECTIYSIKRYVGLCVKGNPTVLETAFAGDSYTIIETPVGKEVRKFIRGNCITKEVFKAYSAYVRA